MNKHTKPTLQKLEQVFKELDYTVRYEKGTFNSGYCIVENSKIAVVNKFFDTDARVGVLMDILSVILEDDRILTEKSRLLYRHLLKSQEVIHK
ncbi:MAG: hypothetical protein IPN89_04325 [Saprospiraceae bacterium]|nr:hypothetical protein [Saprospiraceae bacterium]MBL0099048.1 hypothetical protein [Saprospiraceae bacterium]